MKQNSVESKPKRRSKKVAVAPVVPPPAPKPVVCEIQVAINAAEEYFCESSKVRAQSCPTDKRSCGVRRDVRRSKRTSMIRIGSVATSWRDNVPLNVIGDQMCKIDGPKTRQRRKTTQTQIFVEVTRDSYLSYQHYRGGSWRKRACRKVEHSTIRLFCAFCQQNGWRSYGCQNMGCGQRYQHVYTITRLKKSAQMQGEARVEARNADIVEHEQLNRAHTYGDHRGGRKSYRNGGRKRRREDLWMRAESRDTNL
jgi:hypothetical protein